MTTIITPGLFPDIPPEAYHGGIFPDSVSYSTLKLLLEEAGPAKYRAALDSPRVEKRVFDLGTALHAELLGKGGDRLTTITMDAANYYVDDEKLKLKADPTTWATKAAKAARDDAYARGFTPLLVKDQALIDSTIDALPAHIRDWFTGGEAEVAILWEHETGVKVRGQLDYVRDDAIVDLKTIRATDTRTVERQVWDLRYYLQAATYQTGYEALTGIRLPYYIVTVDLANPHLSRTFEVPDDYLAIGRIDLDRAINTYLDCTQNGVWPAYEAAPERLRPPAWATVPNLEAEAAIAALENMIGETHD